MAQLRRREEDAKDLDYRNRVLKEELMQSSRALHTETFGTR